MAGLQTPSPGAGGFVPPRAALPSPAPSTASSRIAALLPQPRSRPLVPGSKKEDYARDYVSRRLLHVSRRYVKKFGIPDPADEITGYETLDEVCHDLEEVVDVLWFSGTRGILASLQVPYLLNVALAFNTYLPSFPPAPRPTFAFLRKLDHCFASLLVGHDVKTKEILPGFRSPIDGSILPRFSRTDMVRCKSLADETRMLVAMVVSGEVDVIDDDEDVGAIRRPARAKTEEPIEPVDAADPTLRIFPEVDDLKPEEFEDDSDDGLDFDDVDIGAKAESPAKRKLENEAEDVSMASSSSNSKRVKVEEEEDGSVDLGAVTPADTGADLPVANTSTKGDKGVFHWALDDDDDSSDEEDSDPSSIQKPLPTPPNPPESNTVGGGGRSIEDTGADEGDEEVDEDDDEGEVDDEDEEMHMNVGRVYEKTLVQLGESLGQSIVGD